MNPRYLFQTSPETKQAIPFRKSISSINSGGLPKSQEAPFQRLERAVKKQFRSDEDAIRIEDEFSANFCLFVIKECQEIMISSHNRPHGGLAWDGIDAFLKDEMGKLAHLKELRVEAAKDCEILAKKTLEALNLNDPDKRFERLEACQFVFFEKQMIKDSLNQRIEAIVDYFVAEILAGASDEANRDERELRLRACFAKI